MKLVLIEGPAKRETIKKYLGSDFEVFATKGHIRDLPVKTLGVDVQKNYNPTYEIIQGKEDLVKQLKQKASKAEKIYLATDPDREGEAISWHLSTILGLDKDAPVRVEFNELSKNAVQGGINSPRALNYNLIDAQQARRVLDRLMGYKLSPLLSQKIRSKLSAGRVQSVVLKLVVDREKKIQSFVPEEYWDVNALLNKVNDNLIFKADLSTYQSKKIKIENSDQMQKVVADLKNANYVVSDVKESVVYSKSPAPYITSTLQQDAINKLKMSLSAYTKCAQDLYEGIEIQGEGKTALITYIRTDSTRVAVGAQEMAKQFIFSNFGPKYAPAKYNVYETKKGAQDAHEAIRPITLQYTPESLKNRIESRYLQLYTLVFNRFLASQMTNAQFDSLTVDISANDYSFRASGKALKFDGFLKVYKQIEDEKSGINIPNLVKGEVLNLSELKYEQKFTKPPVRYTDATLVKEMEDKGIGRPATYAATVLTISNREYTTKDGKYILPTELGVKVVEFLEGYFENLMNVKFTADMEEKLDDIELGGKNWKEIIDKFYGDFTIQLDNAYQKSQLMKKEVEVSDVVCEKCGAKMVYREGKFGRFLACPNYPKCKNTMRIESEHTVKEKGICPKCGGTVSEKFSTKGKTFFGCDNYPKCDYVSWDLPIGKCPKCNSTLLKSFSGKKERIYCENKDCDYKKIINEDDKE